MAQSESPRIPSISSATITGPLSPAFFVTGQAPIWGEKLVPLVSRCALVTLVLVRLVASTIEETQIFPGHNILMRIFQYLLFIFPAIQCIYLFINRKSIQRILIDMAQRVLQCKLSNRRKENQFNCPLKREKVDFVLRPPSCDSLKSHCAKPFSPSKLHWPLFAANLFSLLLMAAAGINLLMTVPPFRHKYIPPSALTDSRFVPLAFILMAVQVVHEVIILNWLPMSVALYLQSFCWLHAYKLHSLESMFKLILQGSAGLIRAQLEQVESIHKRFDDVFSFIPFLWFVNNFTIGLAFLLEVLRDNNSFGSPISSYVLAACAFYSQMLALAVVCIVSSLQNRLANCQLGTLLLRTMEAKSLSVQDYILFNRIGAFLTSKLTIWHIWPIESSFAVSYCASACTFSILFFQMFNTNFFSL